MTTILVIYLLLAALAGLAAVALPPHLRQFCLTPRSLCRFCASSDSCPVRHLKLSLKLEPRDRPLVVRLPESTHVITFDPSKLKLAA